VFSVVFFLFRAFGGAHLIATDVGVLALLLTLLWIRIRRESPDPAQVSPDVSPHWPKWFRRVVSGAFGLALAAAAHSAIRQTLWHPHGNGWDAFAIWNLHARFLYGPHWRDGFSPLLPWSHPDYPLLVPAAIAHFWSYLGNEDPRVPALIGLAFTFATVGILFSALDALRGRAHAMLAAIALLATPAFIEQGTWQYADIPLSFFLLTTIALLCLHEDRGQAARGGFSGWLALAGLAAGFAAWTKNEGVLFLAAIILARQVTVIGDARKGNGKIPFARHSGLLLAGALPLLVVIIYFKHWIAPPGDLFSDASSIVRRIVQPSRYWAVLRWYVKELVRFGEWLAIPGTLLLAGLLTAAGREKRVRNRGERASLLALSLTLAGYFTIYLITPYDIYWHLRFSLGRLFLQLWPSALFLAFLAMGADRAGPHTVSQ